MRRSLLVFIVVLIFNSFVYSQNTKLIDSLKLELKARKTDDSLKVMILTQLHENLMFSKPEEAKQYALQELEISKKINYKKGIGVGNLHLGNYFSNRSENDSALHYYQIAKKHFQESNSVRGIIFINHSVASIEQIRGDFNEAIKINKENLELIKNNEKESDLKTRFIGAQYNSLANIYIEKGNYNLALSNALKALDLFDKINDLTRKADVLKQIGDIEYGLENYNSSLEYFKKAIKIYKDFDDKIYLALAYNSIGLAYKELGELEEAFKSHELAISLAREVQDKSSLSSALHNLGELHMVKKEFNKAKSALLESKAIAMEDDLKLNIVNAYEGLAKVDFQTNRSIAALSNIDKGIEISKSMGALPHLKSLYLYRSEILESLNNHKAAIFYFKESQKINDSLFSIKKTQQIEELKTIYETEKKEAEIVLQKQEIASLNAQAKNDKLTKTLYGIGMFSFLAISGLIYFGFKQRIKKNKIAREKQEAIYKQEIEFKKKELTSQTLHLVQKNTFIQDLKENLERIKQSPELFKVEFRRLVMLLKKESAEDKDWEVFKSYFSEVHNNFDIKLKDIYPDISEKEIRLASFLRMNLSTKEIASMINVLPESVTKSKYRLKKKLHLDKDTDLNVFLNNL